MSSLFDKSQTDKFWAPFLKVMPVQNAKKIIDLNAALVSSYIHFTIYCKILNVPHTRLRDFDEQ